MNRPGWRHRLGPRIHRYRTLKRVGTVTFIAVFFAGYFLTLHCHLFPVTVMPATRLDQWIGFHPSALIPYVSLWLYVPLAPALIERLDTLLGYLWTATAVSLTGFLIFILWPTMTPRAHVDWAQHPAFGFLKNVDHSHNACPSLHAAFAVLTVLWLDKSLREIGPAAGPRLLNALWCLAIVYSTLATKQHVVVDILAGTALAAGVYGLQRAWVRIRRPSASISARLPVTDAAPEARSRLDR